MSGNTASELAGHMLQSMDSRYPTQHGSWQNEVVTNLK